MAESHTKGVQRHQSVTPAVTDGRTALARASDGGEPKFYDPARGREEPPAVTAARARHQANNAKIDAARAALDAKKAGEHDG